MVQVSVIIPAHNAGATIDRQLAALCQQNFEGDFEVIVVLNRCSDDTAKLAESYRRLLDIRVVSRDERPSAAYARNEGAKLARSSLLLFCDADDEVSSNWISEMTRPLVDGSCDLVGGMVVVDRRGLRSWLYDWRYSVSDGVSIRELKGRLPYVISASMGVLAPVFARLGGFDEMFSGAGGEDVDFCWRAQMIGYRLGAADNCYVTYSPRIGIRDNLHQARSYARGDLLLEAKLGTIGRPVTGVVMAKILVCLAIRETRVRRRVNLAAIAVICFARFQRWQDHRRWTLGVGDDAIAKYDSARLED